MKLFALSTLLCGLTLGALPNATAEDEVNYQPLTFSADVGTLGLGVSASWRFSDHFGARVGLNYWKYEDDGNEIEGINYNTEMRLLSQPFALDIYPWANRSFHISVGALLNQNRLTGVVPQDPVANNTFITFNGNQYDSAAIGAVNTEIEQDAIAPFISIGGSFYFDKAKHWSLSGEVGVAYTGSPEVALSTSNPNTVLQADLDAERQQLEDNAEDFKFYPILKLSVNFSF